VQRLVVVVRRRGCNQQVLSRLSDLANKPCHEGHCGHYGQITDGGWQREPDRSGVLRS